MAGCTQPDKSSLQSCVKGHFVAALGVGFIGAIVFTASAQTSANQSGAAAAGTLGSDAPGAGTNLAATYDGGQVSNTEVVERLSEPWFVTEAEQNAPTNAQMGQAEHVARHLAALHI